jgi:serine/threonine-protein kinase
MTRSIDRGLWLRTLALASACWFVAADATAEPTKANDPAAAQALFYEARTLMHQGKFVAACPKLQESLRLDYGMGTEFNLAECNEKLGKLATAWSGFINVAAAARAANQPPREKLARDRAAALEPRLPSLTIEVAEPAANLEVKRDGIVVGPASWHTPAPVDPGPHQITAMAPGRKSWETTVNAVEGRPLRVDVPALAVLVAGAAPTAAPGETAPETATTTTTRAMMAFPEPIVEQSDTQRTLGWVATGLGLAGLGVAAGFGIDSLVERNAARAHCNGDLCDPTGLDRRDRAITSGNVATVTAIAGGAVFAGGLVLVLTAPKRAGGRDMPAAGAIFAAPRVATDGAGVSLGGSFQ